MDLARLRPHATLTLYYNSHPVIDQVLASILYHIDRTGSILRASRLTGVSYSTAWEKIQQAETILHAKLVEARRGGRKGGGATLTSHGRELLMYYDRMHRRILGTPFQPVTREDTGRVETKIFTGSHDPLMERALGEVGGWEALWTGSLGGAASILLDEADIAGVHVPGGEDYNVHVLDMMDLRGIGVLVRGYERSIGFVSRHPLGSVEEALELIASGRVRIANRQPGSGSRLLLESLLKRSGVDDFSDIPGWDTSYRTHFEVAEAVARGSADIGVALGFVAGLYRLSYVHVCWERYDLLVNARRGGLVEEAGRLLSAARRLSEGMGFYRFPNDSGSVVY